MQRNIGRELDLVTHLSVVEGGLERIERLLTSADEALAMTEPRIALARERIDDALYDVREVMREAAKR